ncbi:3'(2'),5'-bisphosphate nucleotidase CysQ [Salibacterium qingdaonense]|uniref:3'(2'),5'-bisphosphate nucleotidase CysQ n=1 Tax=Salibacterium qingdaonense TaxID=266892 RepID=A0A1I4PW94_9BACI|nr:3'(2'),5'-bisphosphate nucleotidase CysQ [Salibacterium qingdaonense]SFM32102.1 3'(2'), 5'-bisphosphate nucleotidase [Salibacterium qingdaonense]
MKTVIDAALDAGAAIMEIYGKDFNVEYKEDDSPLTIADQRANQLITDVLQQAFPDIPVLSEEGQPLTYDERTSWDVFFLVDPLDGTKEFIKKNGEFTVNIARIENGRPVSGVIYAPALDLLYIGDAAKGAVKVEQAAASRGDAEDVDSWFHMGTQLPLAEYTGDVIRVIASRSHMSKETGEFIEQLKSTGEQVETISTGSSLKLCLIAEGNAQFYPRFAPTMEWDTGAGHAIVEAAGGSVRVAGTDETLRYNKKDLHNPWFLAETGE